MCEPATLTLAATAVAMIGQGVSAYGENQQARYEAQVRDMNSRIKYDQARDALDRGRIDNIRFQRQASREKGALRAAMGANGIDPDSGSAMDTQVDMATFHAEDAQTIRENAIRETRGFEIDAINETARARAARRAGRAALISGAFNVASTALGGATQFRNLQLSQGGRK